MSHVEIGKTEPGKPVIVDIEAVFMAAKNLGMVVEKRPHYKWYGHHVGDYAVPQGWSSSELGKNAVYVLSISAEKKKELGITGQPYELAIIEDKLNPGCFTYMYDFYQGGHGLDKVIGSPIREGGGIKTLAPKFLMHYRMCADALSAAELGDEIEFTDRDPETGELFGNDEWRSYTYPSEERLRG